MRLWIRALAGVSLGVSLATGPAHADVKGAFKEAWKCVTSMPESAVALGKDVLAKGEAVAAMSATVGVCAAQTGGQPQVLAFTTATLTSIKLSKPELLPSGQCKARIHGQVARPFALGIATVLPDGAVRTKLVKLAESEESAAAIWSTLAGAPPPFGTIPSQLDCACDLIDGGVTLTDLSMIANVIRNTSKSCAGVLDQAGLGFVNDWGSAGIAWLGGAYKTLSGQWQSLQGKKEPAPDEIVYQGMFGAYVPQVARSLATAPPRTSALSITFTNAPEGWANLPPTGYQGGWKITWDDLTKACRDYYDQHKFADDHKGKCNAFRDHAAAQASKDGERLRTQGIAIIVFKQRLYQWIKDHWLWRLPPCEFYGVEGVGHRAKGDENMCDLVTELASDRWKLGAFKENKSEPWAFTATGVYAAARDALVQSGYDQDLAHKATLAGTGPAVRDTTLALWNQTGHKNNVRYRWLPQWMPRKPMLEAHGCPAGGAIAKECVTQVEKTFDAICHPMIRDAYVLPVNVLGVAFKLGEAKASCQKLLEAIVSNATTLRDKGLEAVQAKAGPACPTPSEDRAKAAACTTKLSTIWEGCATKQVGNVLSNPIGAATQCFQNATKTMLHVPPGALQQPTQTVPLGKVPPPSRR